MCLKLVQYHCIVDVLTICATKYFQLNSFVCMCVHMFVCVCVCLRGADGKKIKRLYTQITKETRGVQCLVAEYNATQECPEENILTAEALNLSKLQLRLQLMGVQAMGTKVEERQEIIQAY